MRVSGHSFLKKAVGVALAAAMVLPSAAVPAYAAESSIDASGYVTVGSGGTAVVADGTYTADVEIMHAGQVNTTKGFSMANNAIDHTAKISVTDGQVTAVIDFNYLNIGSKQGRLGTLSYFENGFTVNQYGNITGSIQKAEVLSIQRNEDGTPISDDLGTDYPDKVALPIVSDSLKLDSDEADTNIRLYSDGGSATGSYTYSPIQVFVPVMAAISPDTGTQKAYVRINWSTLQTYGSDPVAEAKQEESEGVAKEKETAEKKAAEEKAAAEAAAKKAAAEKAAAEAAAKNAVTVTNKVKIKKLVKGKKSFTVKWKKSSGVTGYQISYSLKKSFEGAKTVTVKGAKKTSKKVKKLKAKKTYYVRIRAYKTVKGTKYYGSWSAAKKVKTK